MNNFANLMETILRLGALALRKNAIFPRLVLQDFSAEEAKKGDVINVSYARPKTAQNVVAGTAPNYDDLIQDNHPITLDQWKQAAFRMSDKDMKEVSMGIFPSEASEAIKALMDQLDTYIITQMYEKCPYVVGTPATVPDSTDFIVDVRKQLRQNAGLTGGPRSFVMDSTVEANMLKLAAFTNVQDSGRLSGLEEGDLGRKYGFTMAADQNMDGTSFFAGTHAGTTLINNAAVAIGDASVPIDGGTASTTAKKGEVFTVAGDSQKYILTADVADVNSGIMAFWPPAKVAWANNAVVTFQYVAGQTINLHSIGFNRDFFGLVNRRFEGTPSGLGVLSSSVTDDVTGLTLRLEVTREHKMTNWAYDILYGGDVIRPPLGTFLRS